MKNWPHRVSLLLYALIFTSATSSLFGEDSTNRPITQQTDNEKKLLRAITEGDLETCTALLDAGTSTTMLIGEHKDTILMRAVRELIWLIKRFNQKLFTDKLTYTRAYYNRLSLIQYLLFHPRVNPFNENTKGESALSIAQQEGLRDVVALFDARNHMPSLATQEFDQYKKKLNELTVPEPIRTMLAQAIEQAKIKSTSPLDKGRERDYLTTLFSLPWSTETTDNLNLSHAQIILNENHYGLTVIKERILDFMAGSWLNASRQLSPHRRLILCLVGPPGTGKTSLAHSIARALNRTLVKVSLGGEHDASALRGHARSFVNACPGSLLKALIKAKTKNPVMLLDEIDKLASANQWLGDPAGVLLEALDPEQNHQFIDNYIDIPFDLSNVIFIATANTDETIPHALRDRLELIYLDGYTPEEKLFIAQKYLIKKTRTFCGLTEEQFALTDPVLTKIIEEHTYEAGVRKLEQHIHRLGEKTARALLEKNTTFSITPESLTTLLGAPLVFTTINSFAQTTEPGVARGLVWTPHGGRLLPIETCLVPGNGSIKITGNTRFILNESAFIALNYVMIHASELGFDATLFQKNDIHLHIPEGAMPKDGPSAGIAILSAIASRITNRPCTPCALTGEITLTGKVLPVGGLKEKLLAAQRVDIKTVIIPRDNLASLEEFKDLIPSLTIIPVSHASEVLEHALTKENKP